LSSVASYFMWYPGAPGWPQQCTITRTDASCGQGRIAEFPAGRVPQRDHVADRRRGPQFAQDAVLPHPVDQQPGPSAGAPALSRPS